MSLENLLSVLEKYKEKSLMIVMKGSPDPDCISSSLAISALCDHYNIDNKIYHQEPISLPCNNRMINELDINVQMVPSFEDVAEDYDGYIVVDFQDRSLDVDIPCIIHIDHHKEVLQDTNTLFQDIQLDVSSAATILTHYLKSLDFLKDYDNARNLATALAYGIRTDSDDLTLGGKKDYAAIGYLVDYYDKNILQSISRSTLSKMSMSALIKALDSKGDNMVIKDNWLFAGVETLKSSQKDTLAMIADILISIDGIDNVCVYGIIENDETYIGGSVRTFDFSYDLNNLLSTFSSSSGARKNKGGFKIPLGAFSCVSDKATLWILVKDLVMTKFSSQISFTKE